MVRLARREHLPACRLAALGIVGHHLDVARFILHLVPHQAVAFLHGLCLLLRAFRAAALALAVDKQFRRGVGGVDKHRCHLPLAARPRPVGQHVERFRPGVPHAAVQVEAVLGQRGQVDDAEHRRVVGPGIRVVGRRLAQVVEARPYELPDGPVEVVGQGEVNVRNVRPRAIVQVVAAALVVRRDGISLAHGGEVVHAARADRRRRFGAQHDVLRQPAVGLLVAVGAVVETGNVEHGRKTVVQHARHLVHAAGDGARGVLAVADVAQELGHLIPLGRALGGHLVAHAPHHYRRVVAVLPQHVHHVALRPFAEVAVVTVVALRNVPFVERLQHHHEAHLVAQLDQLRCGHVVRGAHGIAAHVLEHQQLVAQGTLVDGRAEGAEVVVQTDALELAVPAVEVEALVGHILYAAHAEARFVHILHLAARFHRGDGGVEAGRFGRPQLRVVNGEVLLEGFAVVDVALVRLARHLTPLCVAHHHFEGEEAGVGVLHGCFQTH